jgi:hypothetical protein
MNKYISVKMIHHNSMIANSLKRYTTYSTLSRRDSLAKVQLLSQKNTFSNRGNSGAQHLQHLQHPQHPQHSQNNNFGQNPHQNPHQNNSHNIFPLTFDQTQPKPQLTNLSDSNTLHSSNIQRSIPSLSSPGLTHPQKTPVFQPNSLLHHPSNTNSNFLSSNGIKSINMKKDSDNAIAASEEIHLLPSNIDKKIDQNSNPLILNISPTISKDNKKPLSLSFSTLGKKSILTRKTPAPSSLTPKESNPLSNSQSTIFNDAMTLGVGSKLWMAPEAYVVTNSKTNIVENINNRVFFEETVFQADYSYPSDIYSLGIVLFEIICQSPPAENKNDFNWGPFSNPHGNNTPLATANEVPLFIKMLITSCLSPRPEDRPSAKAISQLLTLSIEMIDNFYVHGRY